MSGVKSECDFYKDWLGTDEIETINYINATLIFESLNSDIQYSPVKYRRFECEEADEIEEQETDRFGKPPSFVTNCQTTRKFSKLPLKMRNSKRVVRNIFPDESKGFDIELCR